MRRLSLYDLHGPCNAAIATMQATGMRLHATLSSFAHSTSPLPPPGTGPSVSSVHQSSQTYFGLQDHPPTNDPSPQELSPFLLNFKESRVQGCQTDSPYPCTSSAIPIPTTAVGEMGSSEKDPKFLCFSIGHLSNTTQFVICSCGVFVFFILYGYFQELIFTLQEFKPYGWYLTFVQFCFYSCFGLLETRVRNDVHRRIPLKTYALLAFLTVGTMGLSNASLGHLNYPTQVIFKCCKLIPVLVGSVLIQGKKYAPLDYVAAVMMCIGLIWFTLADSKLSPVFDLIGLAMISGALFCDAIIGNVQEKAMKAHHASNAEIVLYSYFIGIFYILFYLLISGDFLPAFQICSRHVLQTYGYGFVFSLTGYIGVQIVLQLVRTGGAFAAVTVTTCRKAVTIIISFLVFSKPFSFQYVYSGALVVCGIYLNLYAKKYPEFSILNWMQEMKSVLIQEKPYKKFVQEV